MSDDDYNNVSSQNLDLNIGESFIAIDPSESNNYLPNI